MKFQNYNEFHDWVRWHDYVAAIIHEFPILLIRRYDWMDTEKSTLIVQFFGFKVFQRVWAWVEDADAEYDASPAVPMSEEEIDHLVKQTLKGRGPRKPR